MRNAALGAGASAAVFGAATKAAAAEAVDVDSSMHSIQRPSAFDLVEGTPIKTLSFPAGGANIFAEACVEEGLGALFCCPGNYSIVTALADHGVPAYGGRCEGHMASAADAYTRVTGVTAACSGTEGPGFTQMICAISAANSCNTPLLVLASNRNVRGDDTQQGIQRQLQQPLTEGIKKYGKRVVDKERIHEYAGYAFRQLKAGMPGPVHLDFPTESTARVDSEAELDRYWDKSRYRTETKAHPDPKAIDAALDLLKKAKRPIIVASTGAFYHGACEVLVEFAERMQIPVTETGPMRGKISDDHALCASMSINAHKNADVVVLVGQYCITQGGFSFGPDAKYIRIEPMAEEMGRNIPTDVAIVSDEKAALEALLDKAPRKKHASWLAEIKSAKKEWEDQNDEWYQLGLKYSVGGYIHPSVIARETENFLYKGSVDRSQTTTVAGGFGIGKWMRRVLHAYRPGQVCNGAYQYGYIGPDMGYLFGAGIAVRQGDGYQAVAKGNNPVLGCTGDAGFGFSGMEIETMAKYRVPAIMLVYNNNAWGTWGGGSRSPRIYPAHLFQEHLRYDKMAEALGAHGEYVTSPETMRSALERAWDVAVNDSLPTVINCQAKKEFWAAREYPPGMTGSASNSIEAYFQ